VEKRKLPVCGGFVFQRIFLFVFRVGFLVWGLDRLQVETIKDSKRLKKTQKDMKRHGKTKLDTI
jgi:hypothetical protein